MRLTPENQRVLDAICRIDFVSFTQKAFHTLSPNSTLTTNYHIQSVAYYLELVRLGPNQAAHYQSASPVTEVTYDLSRMVRIRPRP